MIVLVRCCCNSAIIPWVGCLLAIGFACGAQRLYALLLSYPMPFRFFVSNANVQCPMSSIPSLSLLTCCLVGSLRLYVVPLFQLSKLFLFRFSSTSTFTFTSTLLLLSLLLVSKCVACFSLSLPFISHS